MKASWKTTAILLMALALILSTLVGCNNSQPPEASQAPSSSGQSEEAPSDLPPDPLPEPMRIPVSVGGLKGPTGTAMAGLKKAAEEGTTAQDYQVRFEAAPDIIQGQLISGELDIAVVPTNLASILYQKTEGEIQVIALSQMNVLYLMAAPGVTLETMEDLRGKTLFTAAQGSTQEYVLEYLLEVNGLNSETDLNITYTAEQAETVAQLLAGNCDVALLPQPFATTVTMQNPEVTRAISINEEWDKVAEGVPLAMSCIVARRERLEEHPDLAADFIADYQAGIDYARENVAEAAALMEEYEIIPAKAAEAAIPLLDLQCVTGEEMAEAADAYLAILYNQNPKAVGGALPDEAFYYYP